MSKKRSVFIIGPMGAGKSTIGRAVASMLNFEFYDSDQEIEKRTGADIAWIFDIEGETGYRRREEKVIEEISQLSNVVLATGGGAVVTPENRVALTSRGIVIYLKTSLEMQYKRTRHDAKRPMLHTENARARITELWEERSPYYEDMADYAFETDGNSVKFIATQIVDALHADKLV